MAKTEREARAVISDAGPLIHLDELGCLDILDFSEVLVPDAVWQEVTRHRPQALRHPNIRLCRQDVGCLPERIAAIAPLFGLHRGELEALALCIEYPNALLLTDDGAARLAADNLGIATHGTIGLVIRAVRNRSRSMDQGLALLSDIPGCSTLHIRPALLARIIQQVRQEWERTPNRP